MSKDKNTLRTETRKRRAVYSISKGFEKILTSKRSAILIAIYAIVIAAVLIVRFQIIGFPGILGKMQHDITMVLYIMVIIISLLYILYIFGLPKNANKYEKALIRTGFVNSAGEAPFLVDRFISTNGDSVVELVFETDIPIEQWQDKTPLLNAALNLNIVKVDRGRDNQHIIVAVVPGNVQIPKMITWATEFLSDKEFELRLGEGQMGTVSVNLNQIPHVLIGGSTGSGKTILLRSLLMQSILKGAQVVIADFKGVDFSKNWQKNATIIINDNDFIHCLYETINELETRKKEFRELGCSNIVAANKCGKKQYKRIIIACDEVSELLDRTGANKDRKERISFIEGELSTIARQGRAFGIHLILATQRPDANILSGQIKNNIDCRICGKADNVLSQIILDNTDAESIIPKDTSGRFLMNNGTVFQGYWFEDDELENILESYKTKGIGKND